VSLHCILPLLRMFHGRKSLTGGRQRARKSLIDSITFRNMCCKALLINLSLPPRTFVCSLPHCSSPCRRKSLNHNISARSQSSNYFPPPESRLRMLIALLSRRGSRARVLPSAAYTVARTRARGKRNFFPYQFQWTWIPLRNSLFASSPLHIAHEWNFFVLTKLWLRSRSRRRNAIGE
jgi:hypothetical protein